MLQLLPSLENAWINKKNEIENTIEKVKNYLVQINTSKPGEDWDETIIKNSFSSFASKFDPDYGGFGKAPNGDALPAHATGYVVGSHVG